MYFRDREVNSKRITQEGENWLPFGKIFHKKDKQQRYQISQ